MDVRCDRAAEREIICAGLFLGEGPEGGGAALELLKLCKEARPGGACFAADGAIGGIEFQDTVKSGEVEKEAIVEKLLAAHGMVSAGNAKREFTGAGGFYDFGELDEGFGTRAAPDGGGVQLGMVIVDDRFASSAGESGSHKIRFQ